MGSFTCDVNDAQLRIFAIDANLDFHFRKKKNEPEPRL